MWLYSPSAQHLAFLSLSQSSFQCRLANMAVLTTRCFRWRSYGNLALEATPLTSLCCPGPLGRECWLPSELWQALCCEQADWAERIREPVGRDGTHSLSAKTGQKLELKGKRIQCKSRMKPSVSSLQGLLFNCNTHAGKSKTSGAVGRGAGVIRG